MKIELSEKGKTAFRFLAKEFCFQLLAARPARNKQPDYLPVIGSNDMNEIQEYLELFKRDGYLVTVVNSENI